MLARNRHSTACDAPDGVALRGRDCAATAFPLATDAALELLRVGGNAVDAAVGAAWALSACEPSGSGLGGQTVLLIRFADGRIRAIDGHSCAPSAASLESISADEQRRGYRSCTVPTTPATLDWVRRKYGVLSRGRVMEPATRVALVGDARNLASHSAQSAFVSAAMLCARSGATVHLVAPDVPLIGPQPPLRAPNLIGALTDIDGFIVPKNCFVPAAAPGRVDLAVMFGDSPWSGAADIIRSINADAWSALISEPATASEWIGDDWPFGGLAAAVIAAGEGYKAAMRKFTSFAAT